MKFKERYNNLNNKQRKTVDHIDGPLLVVAGPGSGKTEILGIRIANILYKTDTPPSSILCLTYTEAASSNMKERLIDLIGEDAYRVSVHTFHGFCQKILEEHPQYFYQGASFDLADKATQTKILHDILCNLPYDNPLSATHPRYGFVYLNEIIQTISDLKDGGVSPDEFNNIIKNNEKIIQKINPFINKIFSDRVSKKMFSPIGDFVSYLHKINDSNTLSHIKPLNLVIASSLEEVINSNDTKEITQWKNKWTIKQGEERVIKDFYNLKKTKSLAEVYKNYYDKMRNEGYYDFSDMILEVIKKMQDDETFYDIVKERYLYIMVDEFQDTNGVQMRFLNLLTKDRIDDNPNICVVGDDDQAIYRFQGADISNILDFKHNYKRTQIISLQENYRSVEPILNIAYDVIKKGHNRLEKIFPEVQKNLLPNNKEKGEIIYYNFNSIEEEFSFVATKIKKLLNHIPPQEIAVVGRTHDTLRKAIPFFNDLEIPIYAERKEDILQKKHIKVIISIIKFCGFLLTGDNKKADELLPEILSYPFWEIDREHILNISYASFISRKSWIKCMKKNKQLRPIANFLLDLSIRSKTDCAEEIIDIIIGNKKGYMQSPYKEYYFSKNNFEENRPHYINLLSSLKSFIRHVRNYKTGKNITVKDIQEFLEIIEKNNITLLDKNPLVTSKNAVSLITAHGAKGKEFEAVFVLNCEQDVWAKSKKGDKLALPSNMPLKKAGEERDDQLRLFYVTLTRAKSILCMTKHHKRNDGKQCIPLEFLTGINIQEKEQTLTINKLSSIAGSCYLPPFTKNEQEFLFL